jgi:hypothetical protein
MSIESELDALTHQIETARAAEAARAPRAKSVLDILGQAPGSPSREAVFNQRLEALEGHMRGCGIEPSILIKVARAMAEARISEAVVWRITAGAKRAGKPGAYFVASIKREFERVSLPWFEEEWS